MPPYPSPNYRKTLGRAKETLRRNIREGMIPAPHECDGCGSPKARNQLNLYIYDPRNYQSFSAYCATCWEDHRCNQMGKRRRERYEQERKDESVLAA